MVGQKNCGRRDGYWKACSSPVLRAASSHDRMAVKNRAKISRRTKSQRFILTYGPTHYNKERTRTSRCEDELGSVKT